MIVAAVAKHAGECRFPGAECDKKATWIVGRRSDPKALFVLGPAFRLCPDHVAPMVERMMTVEAVVS